MSFIKDNKELSKDGYLVNHSRVLVGSGLETYEKGKAALQSWRFVHCFLADVEKTMYIIERYYILVILSCCFSADILD